MSKRVYNNYLYMDKMYYVMMNVIFEKYKKGILSIFFFMAFTSVVFGQDNFLISQGNQTITCGTTTTFRDSGDAAGTYANNELFEATYTSSTGGTLTFDFTFFNVEPNGSDCFDVLRVYDGDSTSSPLIHEFCGTDTFSITSTGNALTFVFDSDGAVRRAGWRAEVTCNAISDRDSDGAPNVTDIDSDNDGVIDANEGCANNSNIIGGFGVKDINNTTDDGPKALTGTVATYDFSSNYNAFNSSEIQTQNLTGANEFGPIFKFDGDNGEFGQIDITFSNNIYRPRFTLSDFDQEEVVTVSIYDENNTIIDLSSGDFTVIGSNINQTGTNGEVFTERDSSINIDGDNAGSNPIGSVIFDLFGEEVSRITVRIDHQEGSSLRFTQIDYCIVDTDNDNTPNYLDTDSDNDGCFDAIEGGDNILLANVQANGQLNGTVNTTTGVPNNVDTTNGQTAGTSTDFSAFDSFGQCDKDNDSVIDANDICDGFDDAVDRDNDTIPDGCDEDDDNDGILDANEGCASGLLLGTVGGTPPVGAWEVFVYDGHFEVPNATNASDRPSFGADGVSGGTPVLSAHGFYTGSATSYTINNTNIGSTEDPTPTVTASGVGLVTVTPFTTSNSGMWSIIYKRKIENNGTLTVGAAGAYIDDWVEVFINGVLVDSINAFTSSLPLADVINETISAGDEVEIRLSNGLSLGGFNLTIQTLNETTSSSICNTDTDSDTVFNHLDTDSDDDGCPDAIEGAGTIIEGLSTLAGGSPTADSSSQNLGTDADAEGNPKLNPADANGFIQGTTVAVTDNSDSTACTIDLNITKTVDNALPKVGQDIVYTLTVTNNGPLNATGVSVTDALPAELTYKTDDSAGDYSSNTWNVGALNNGVSKTINITATVNQAGEIVNTAQVVAPTTQTDIDSTPNNGN